MPYPDGTASPTEIDRELNRLALVFKPNAKPSEPEWAFMIREYVTALTGQSAAVLTAGVTRMIQTRTDKFWPTPSEIIAAASNAPLPSQIGQQARKYSEMLQSRDAERREDASRIENKFHADNRDYFARAKAEGWAGMLETTVRAAAKIIAQRNEISRLGGEPSNPPRTHGGVEIPNIECVGGRDFIVIHQHEISRWRSFFGLEPDPGKSLATHDAMA